MNFDKYYLIPFVRGSAWEQMTAVKHFEKTELTPAWIQLCNYERGIQHVDTRLCQAHCADKLLDYIKLAPFAVGDVETIEVRTDHAKVECYPADSDYGRLSRLITSTINCQMEQLLFTLQQAVYDEESQEYSGAVIVSFQPNLFMRRDQTTIEYYLWVQAFVMWPSKAEEASAAV